MTTQTKPTSQTYANPSWTMAIASQPSALSRWWGQSLSQVSSFTLQLKASEESEDEASDAADGGPEQSVVIQGNQSQLEGFSQLTEQYVQAWLGRAVTVSSEEDSPETPSAFWDEAPAWQSEVGYSHRLSIGALQVEPMLRDFRVTTTQLYDLAEILQQSLAEVQPLTSDPLAFTLPKQSFAWKKTAAVAAIALSMTGGLAWFLGGGSVLQTASESEPEERIALNTPQPGPSGESPLTTVPPTFPVKPTKPSTPNPSSKTTTAKKVDPTQSKDPTVKTNTDSVKTAIAQQKQSAIAQQKLSQSDTVTENEARDNATFASSSTEKTAKSSQTSKKISEATPKSEIAAKKKPAQDSNPTKSTAAARESVLAARESLAESVETADAIAAAPPAPLSSEKTLAAAPPVVVPEPSAEAPGSTAGAPATLQSPTTSDFAGTTSRRAAPAKVSKAPILRFFQSQWQGQDSIDQSLIYTIVVNPDGSVRSVVPQNEGATTQLSQTPLPSPGDALLPPFLGADVATFNVTLYPDGTVSVK